MKNIFAATTALVLAACGGASSGTESTTPNATVTSAEMPASAAATTQATTTEAQPDTSAAIDPARVEHGRERFERICGLCHEDGDAPPLRGLSISEAQVRTIVRQGKDHMRPISEARLNNADLDDVLAYLKTLGTIAAAAPSSN